MAQISVFMPESLKRRIRKEAEHSAKSISTFLKDLVQEKMDRGEWRPDFFSKIVGGWKGDFPEIDRPAPEEREGL